MQENNLGRDETTPSLTSNHPYHLINSQAQNMEQNIMNKYYNCKAAGKISSIISKVIYLIKHYENIGRYCLSDI
jgi:hypothetical protein